MIAARPRLTTALFLLLIFSLGFMTPTVVIGGFHSVITDLLFVALAALFGISLARRQAEFRWSPAYWLLIFYFGVMLVSLLGAEDVGRGMSKLATQLYLLGLAILTFNLVRTADDLRMAGRVWLAATAVIALVAVASLLLFAIDPASPWLRYTRFYSGTLPPGDYPRLRLTFRNGNMLCNYLQVSLMILFVAQRLKWVSTKQFALLLGGILLSAIFTISPGLGGIGLGIALWLWLLIGGKRRWAANLFLAGGAIGAALFVLAMMVTPIIHPTAPFLIELNGLGLVLAPSGRLLTWTEALANFLANPLLGRGIGADAVHVRYLDPTGRLQNLTDAHNSFLNIAAQSGIGGLIALLLLLFYVARRSRPFALLPDNRNVARLGLGLAFLLAFGYQGLGGSFEDARHLWVLFGLFLASLRIEHANRASASTGQVELERF